jgi:proteasome lid subunit RPN8/RPN11
VQVEFDGPAVLAREERRHDVVGFLHTHPGFAASPSRRDVATMQAWVSAFGKPLVCLIRGSDGLKGYRFDDYEASGIPLATVEEFPRGIIVGVDSDGRKVSSRRAVSRARAR